MAPHLSQPPGRQVQVHSSGITAGGEWLESNQMTIDERIEALTMNLELAHREILDLKELARQDGENIRALARIAEIHERRLSSLEGDEA